MTNLWLAARNYLRTNERGQSTLEYVLILFVVVSFSVGLLYQFNAEARRFIQVVTGEPYIGCLLKTGELPSLRSQQGEVECPFPSFNFQAGDIPSGESGTNSAELSNSGGGGASSAGGDESSGSGGVSESSGSSRSQPLASSGVGGGAGGRTSKVPLSKSDKGESSNSEEFESPGRRTGASVSGGGTGKDGDGRSRFVTVSDGGDEKEKDKAQAKKGSEEERAGRKRFVAAPDPSERETASIEEDGEWTLGGFLRLLIIVGIIIAILVLLLGQALQIKKGMEK